MNKVIGMVEAKGGMSTDVVCWFCTKRFHRALYSAITAARFNRCVALTILRA